MKHRILLIVLSAVALTSCRVSFSFTTASISPDIKSVSVGFIPNNAPMVEPTLSPALREALMDKFSRQTKMEVLREGGDISFDGEIIDYTTTPVAVTSESEVASMTRLTITVRMTFTNTIDPSNNYSRNFSQFSDYRSSISLQEAVLTLIPEIVDMFVTDMFNVAFSSNW